VADETPEEQPEANAVPPEQPEAAAAQEEQPEAAAAPPEQPESNATPPEQPEAAAAPPEQPESNATPPEQPEAGAAQEPAEPMATTEDPAEPTIEEPAGTGSDQPGGSVSALEAPDASPTAQAEPPADTAEQPQQPPSEAVTGQSPDTAASPGSALSQDELRAAFEPQAPSDEPAAAAGTGDTETPAARAHRPTGTALGTGRRKEAVVRVRLIAGEGAYRLNGRSLEEYFPARAHRMLVTAPLRSAGREKDFDVVARLHGGGVSGQAGALQLGIARALLNIDESLRPALKAEGMLTRDAREKERRKYGLKKARKAPQYSKR
jgi:small subunit ribosomal protein S9